MAFGLLERMLTVQMTLDDFLRAIKRHSLDDYDDQGDSRDVRRTMEDQMGLESPQKRRCAPFALEVHPTRSRSTRAGQNSPLHHWVNFVEAAIPHEPTFIENLSGDGTVKSEDLGGGNDIFSIGKDLGGCGGGISAIGGDLGDSGVAARGENLSSGGSDFFASGGDFGDIGITARGEDLGGDGVSTIGRDLGYSVGAARDFGGGGVSTIGGDLGNGGGAARGENLADCGSDFFAAGGDISAVVLLLGVRT
ncbi:glycine-rich cell wall structural protein 1-like [Capsicum annuum]|uniref:glycine-rich cell wall structural protein 1-like n=1 Tax=Capsicum annuum TaxID=4072 RepID=UPI001FB0F279|nr:glycine-rich cell wall structural protein 1-like [Capsicum annuum]